MSIVKKVRKFLTRKEEGATLVEYALLVALIAVFCITAITALGGGISGLFDRITAVLGAQL